MAFELDPIYQQAVLNAGTTRTNTLAALGGQRTRTALAYGYTPTYDAQTGLVKSLAQDPNDPYAKAQLLKQSYDNNLARNKQNFANRGQYYSGAFGVAQSLADQDYAAKDWSLQQAFINFISSNQAGINAANTNYTTALGNASADAAVRAANADTGEGAAGPAASGPTPGVNYTWPQNQPGQPAQYTGSTGYQNWGPNKGKYIDSNGGIHATQTKNGKTYYLNSNGGWTPI